METYKVLYSTTHCSYGISYEGFIKNYERFPEKYKWDDELNDYKPGDRIYNFVRDDQEIIEFMLAEGLDNFLATKRDSLEVEEVNKLCDYYMMGWKPYVQKFLI